jgi:hypothetical protein
MWQDRPRGRSPAEFSFKAVYGRSNCDRREKSSFSTQSVDTRHLSKRVKRADAVSASHSLLRIG